MSGVETAQFVIEFVQTMQQSWYGAILLGLFFMWLMSKI